MKNWFLQKNDSEQKIIVVLGVFAALLLLYAFLYLPLQRSNAQLKSSIADIENEIAMMRRLEPKFAQFANQNTEKVAMDDTQIMALVEQVAKQPEINLNLSNIKTQSKNKISVTLNNVLFNKAMQWLDILQSRHQISIWQLTVEAQKKGLTNMVVTITH
jgi:general secretion pathway protein M